MSPQKTIWRPFSACMSGMDGFISLLPSGEEIARRIYERHKLLTQFFIRLGVDPEVAAADACKVEHDLSEETFQKMKEHALGGKLPETEW
mgnify:CR=1 FL=1